MFSPFKSHAAIIYDLHSFLKGVGVKDTEACLCWALGNDYGSSLFADTDDRWNARHADLFVLYGSDNVRESTKRIGRAYLQMIANKKEVSDD